MRAPLTIALFSELPAGELPDWIQLLPAGVITTNDGRGPYRVADLAALASASLQAAGGRMVVDESHATDLAAPQGRPAPARGWMVALEARDGGLWAKVEWTDEGRALVAGKSYRGISPVFMHDAKGNVLRLLRASLTNTPNLRGLAALHSESEGATMDLVKLRELLGLSADADEAAILAAIRALKDKPALQSALAPIAKAAGLAADADATAIATAVTVLATQAAGQPEAVKALQAELATVTTALTALQADNAKARATAYVDGAIREGRVGVKPLREHYIVMHAADPARVEKEIGAMPILGPSGAGAVPPSSESGDIDPVALASAASAYQRKLAEAGQSIDFATAVRAVQEKKR